MYVFPGPFSGALFLKEKKKFHFLLYLFYFPLKNFFKIPTFINFGQRSTTSIKTKEDLHPREVVVSVLMDSSVNLYIANEENGLIGESRFLSQIRKQLQGPRNETLHR
jgi:hypothetical protein